MEDLAAGDLKIAARADDAARTLVLDWSGKSNDRQPGRVLDPYFASLVQEAKSRGYSIEMRFQMLAHFNSSTITSIIGVVQKARSEAVRVRLEYDKALKWQKLSFEALRVLGKQDGLLEIQAV